MKKERKHFPYHKNYRPPRFFILELNETKDGIDPVEIFSARELPTHHLVVMTHGFTGDFEGVRYWAEPIAVSLFEKDVSDCFYLLLYFPRFDVFFLFSLVHKFCLSNGRKVLLFILIQSPLYILNLLAILVQLQGQVLTG